MELSVVIPVVDDMRVFRVLRQVMKAGAEPVIVCNGSPQSMIDAIAATGSASLVLPQANLGRALDEGIHAARYDTIVLMDSDCVFAEGALAFAATCLRAHALVRGTCHFASRGPVSRVIANVRTITTTIVVGAYKPPLALARRRVAERLGHFFDHAILWCEDAEFDARRTAAGIDVHFAPQLAILHDPLTIGTDLRSAWRYGRGYARATLLGLPMRHYDRHVAARGRLTVIERAYLHLFETVEKTSERYWRCADVRLAR